MEAKEITTYFKYQRIGTGITEGLKRLFSAEGIKTIFSENIKASYFVTMKKKACPDFKA